MEVTAGPDGFLALSDTFDYAANVILTKHLRERQAAGNAALERALPRLRRELSKSELVGLIRAIHRRIARGRLKEMIKTGGVNVAPLEVEQVLLKHPDVVQAYVVGVPDQAKGEIVAAVVELRAGAATDTASIIAFCRERLASYKVPIRLAFRTAAQLPRTTTGKIHKPTLSQELAAQPDP